MKAPTRGLKNVEGGLIEDRSAIDGIKLDSATFQEYMIAPFHSTSAPSAWRAIVVALLVYVGTTFNSWVFHATLDGLLKSTLVPTAADFMIRALFIGCITATAYVTISGWWSFDDQLPTIIYPEVALAKIASRRGRLGLVTALVYCAIIFAGAATGGAILRILDTAPVNAGIINVATDPAGRWIYWICVSLFVFAGLWCSNLLQEKETEMQAFYRSIYAGAGMLFIFTLGFAGHGLRSFSSSHYVAASIATGTNVDWPIYVFVALLAAPATAVLLYGVFSVLIHMQGGRYTKVKTDDAEAQIPMNASSRVRGKIQVTY